jgi:hypothetical protein
VVQGGDQNSYGYLLTYLFVTIETEKQVMQTPRKAKSEMGRNRRRQKAKPEEATPKMPKGAKESIVLRQIIDHHSPLFCYSTSRLTIRCRNYEA